MKTNKLFFLVTIMAFAQLAFSQGIGNHQCNPPLSASIENVAPTSAQFVWMAGNETMWQIEVGTFGFEPGSGHAVVNENFEGRSNVNNTFYVKGLAPNSKYSCYIKSVCGCNNSEWIGPFNFSTVTIYEHRR